MIRKNDEDRKRHMQPRLPDPNACHSVQRSDHCTGGEGFLHDRGRGLGNAEGNLEACLIQSGAELSRTALERGYFELNAGSEQVKNARDLQIDIVQSGRHIGTFLLKKESTDGVYIF